jgi:hypothetical protein
MRRAARPAGGRRVALVSKRAAVAQSARAVRRPIRILESREAKLMQKDIEVGDYLLSLNAVPKAAEPEEPDADGHVPSPPPERYAIRVRVTRLDRQPVHGAALTSDSGEMEGGHGPFETVAEAIAHGEAWGRHYVARVLGHAV